MTEQNRTEQVQNRTGTEQNTPQPKWVPVLFATTAALLAGLIIAPLSLSAQDIIDWARTGLNLAGLWPLVVFYSLDATAFICVLICFYCAYMGQSAGMFSITVWAIAVLSAYAQYGHGMRNKEQAPDGWWFFPAMALLAPFMLELVLRKVRAVQRQRRGLSAKTRPKFPIWRWLPGIGSFVETYGAWRVSLLMNLETYDQCIQEYRRLCPSGGLKVLAAMRAVQQAAAIAETEQNTPDPEEPTREQRKEEPKTEQEQETEQNSPPKTEQPKKKPKQNRRADKKLIDEQYLELMRRTWPNELPSGYKVRTELNVNYPKSVQLLEAREKELKK